MLNKIITIARNTFREAVRDRVLYNLVLFVLLITAGAIFLGELTAGHEARTIVNLGLSAILVFGAFIAIFVGVGLVSKESARLRLLQFDSLDERDAIRKVLKDYQTQTGRCADNWREILPLLRNIKLPDGKDFRLDQSNNLIDPTDAPYVLDKENCDVELNLEKTKIPIN